MCRNSAWQRGGVCGNFCHPRVFFTITSLSPSLGAMRGFHLAPQTRSPPRTLAWFQDPHEWDTVLLLLDPFLPSGLSLPSPEADPEAGVYLGGGPVDIRRSEEARWEGEGSDKGAACSRGNLQMQKVLGGVRECMGLPLAGPCGHHSPESSAPVSCSGPPGQGEQGASHRSTLGGKTMSPAAQGANPESTAYQLPGLSRSLPGPL